MDSLVNVSQCKFVQFKLAFNLCTYQCHAGRGGGGGFNSKGWGFDLTHSPVGKEFDVLSCSGGDAI